MKIYIIAGEPSGDSIGSCLIKAIRSISEKIEIAGVGGEQMREHEFNSLFDIKEISIGGITEVLPKILKINKLIQRTISDILIKKPDVVVTIDSPGFSFRVARLLRKKVGREIKLVHYVAPTVWAWRSSRAKKISKIYDHLLTLFDFEPQYFEKEQLATTFVGHPAVEEFYMKLDNEQKSEDILVMPGSREQEIRRLLPVFLAAARKIPGRIVVPTLPHLKELVNELVSGINVLVEVDNESKKQLYRNAKLAIVASGTATLELALSGCPMVVAYRLSNITFNVLKFLVKTKFISLVNIITGEKILTELIQNDCTEEKLLEAINNIDRLYLYEIFKLLPEKLMNKDNAPSLLAAETILSVTKK